MAKGQYRARAGPFPANADYAQLPQQPLIPSWGRPSWRSGPRTMFGANGTTDNALGPGLTGSGTLFMRQVAVTTVTATVIGLGLEWVLHPVMIFDTKTDTYR